MDVSGSLNIPFPTTLNVNLNVTLSADGKTAATLADIVNCLAWISKGVNAMATSFDDLVAQVRANENVEAAAVAAIKELVARITNAAANPDPAVLAQLVSDANASAAALGAAIATVPAAAPAAPAPAAPADTAPAPAAPAPAVADVPLTQGGDALTAVVPTDAPSAPSA